VSNSNISSYKIKKSMKFIFFSFVIFIFLKMVVFLPSLSNSLFIAITYTLYIKKLILST